MSELIPGTALPVKTSADTGSGEGRGSVELGQGRSLLAKLADRDDISPSELLYVDAALRAFVNQPKKKRTYWVTAGGQTDATTGNCVIPVYQVPAGMMCGVANLTVDTPDAGTTITPSAPFANAASWAFIATASETSLLAASAAATLRRGAIAFAPSSAGGPIVPGQWTFSESSAPVAFPGDMIYYVLVGGSIALITGKALQVKLRVNLVASD